MGILTSNLQQNEAPKIEDALLVVESVKLNE